MRGQSIVVGLAACALVPSAAMAHAPSVIDGAASSPSEAIVLEDPTLSRAIGATIERPGEVDWYRLDMRAGEPLVLGMTEPDAEGGIAATFTLFGPGLPAAADAGAEVEALALAAGVDGAVVFEPSAEPPLERHGGLGFVNYGTLRLEAPADGSYWVAVEASHPDATGKYVFAPGVREEFGLDAIDGMVDLIRFFEAPWPPEAEL